MNNPNAAWMPMNLQLFAEGDTEPAQQDGQSQEGGGTGAPQLTMEDVMRMIQSESDKRVTQATNKLRKEYEKKLSLSGLDEQERNLKERDQRIEELTDKLKAAQVRENQLELARTLSARGMPVEFADLIEVGEDLEEAQKRIEKLDAAFKKTVEEAVDKRIAGKGAPGRSNAKTFTSRDDIMKIADAAERQAAIANNLDLFMKG